MENFRKIHGDAVEGTLSMFDRMIFKGHMTRLMPKGAFGLFLNRQGVLLKDFGSYVQEVSGRLKLHAQQVAEAAHRPFEYLAGASTKRSGESKEDRARAIAERDGIEEGLRLQSWFPFGIQVYMNGRAWLAQQLEREGIGFSQHANAFIRIHDLPRARALCERFARRRWPRVLDRLARRVNPMLPVLEHAGFGGYYWCLDQAEWATDVMFRSRKDLDAIYPALIEHATSAFGATDVLRFPGRKLTGNFKGEATTDLKRREEGRRVKHRMKRNSLKMYDKHSVLRIETTINNPPVPIPCHPPQALRALRAAHAPRQ
jgi:hypothetical protein